MKKTLAVITALTIFSSLYLPASADDFAPRGGFFAARLAAKKLKKLREQEHFSGADQNKDGSLNKQEIDSAKKSHGIAVDDDTFKKIDKNGDGQLSHDECEKYHQEMEKNEKKEAQVKSGKDAKTEENPN
jgi:Ca2+-binding EF-hand superfamily protein